MQRMRLQAMAPTTPAAASGTDLAPPGTLAMGLTLYTQMLTPEAVERIAAIEAAATGVDLQAAMQAAASVALPPGTQVLSVYVSSPLIAPPPPPAAPGMTPAPGSRPATSSKLVWATSARSPRYAKGQRPAGEPLGAERAVGVPQLLMSPVGAVSCAPNLKIAWVPTMARPRFLEVYMNGSTARPIHVNVSHVLAVEVAVTFLGSSPAPLHSVELLVLPKDSPPKAALVTLPVYTFKAGDPRPVCPALNRYPIPPEYITGPHGSARIVGVRLRPSQDRARSKMQMMQVRMAAVRFGHEAAACMR